MKHRKLLGTLSFTVLLVFALGFLPVFAANMTTVPGVSSGAKKFSFTLSDLNKTQKMYTARPQLLLSWQTRVRIANDALARDAAAVKKDVDDVLVRADAKYTDCSAQNYTLQELQGLCQPNEGVQACLDRLRWDCMMTNAMNQQVNNLANALAAMNIQTALDRMKKEITTLEQALYK